MNHENTFEYGKPEIADYGSLEELTEACFGEGSDGSALGLSSAHEYNTSRIHCVTTP